MTRLQRIIVLSNRCVAALDSGDHVTCREIMRRRDALYIEMQEHEPLNLPTFRAWANGDITERGIDRILATDEAS